MTDLSFDDNGNSTQIVGFQYPDDDPETNPQDSDIRAAQQAALLRVFQKLDRGSLADIARRVVLLHYSLRKGNGVTQRAIARRLEVSPGRVTQLIKTIRSEGFSVL